MSLVRTADLPPVTDTARSIAEWFAQQKDWKPGEAREIPRELAQAYRDELATALAPKILEMRRREAEAYQRIKDMVIF